MILALTLCTHRTREPELQRTFTSRAGLQRDAVPEPLQVSEADASVAQAHRHATPTGGDRQDRQVDQPGRLLTTQCGGGTGLTPGAMMLERRGEHGRRQSKIGYGDGREVVFRVVRDMLPEWTCIIGIMCFSENCQRKRRAREKE